MYDYKYSFHSHIKNRKKIGNSLFIYDYSYYYTINDHIVIQYDQILHKIIH